MCFTEQELERAVMEIVGRLYTANPWHGMLPQALGKAFGQGRGGLFAAAMNCAKLKGWVQEEGNFVRLV